MILHCEICSQPIAEFSGITLPMNDAMFKGYPAERGASNPFEGLSDTEDFKCPMCHHLPFMVSDAGFTPPTKLFTGLNADGSRRYTQIQVKQEKGKNASKR